MTVTLRPYRNDTSGKVWEVDIRFAWPDGSEYRKRTRAPVGTKSGAKRWGEDRERHLLRHGPSVLAPEAKEVPTVEQFVPRFMEDYCEANKHKESGKKAKRYAFRCYVVPLLGQKRLDALTHEDVARLKGTLKEKSAKTTNNVLAAFNTMLRLAAEWGVIGAVPVSARLLKVQHKPMGFYDEDELERLVQAAERLDRRILVSVLLGAEAGLRRGEIIALDWADVDLKRGEITVSKSEVEGIAAGTKGMEYRHVQMTDRLRAALATHRHLKGPRVLYADDGETASPKTLQRWLARAQRLAGLRDKGGCHILRHTFCSHLAMRGAPPSVIQALAGHKNLQTTLKYMHLAPGETHRAIALLNKREASPGFGEIVEKRNALGMNPSRLA
jgi:integrase